MHKELIIGVIIIIIVFSLEVITQGYTKKSGDEMIDLLSELETHIINKDKEEIKNEIKNINDKWDKKQKRLAYYIEHNEIEKIGKALVLMKSYIETEDYSSSVAQLEEASFVLEHIEDRYSFNLQNVF